MKPSGLLSELCSSLPFDPSVSLVPDKELYPKSNLEPHLLRDTSQIPVLHVLMSVTQVSLDTENLSVMDTHCLYLTLEPFLGAIHIHILISMLTEYTKIIFKLS